MYLFLYTRQNFYSDHCPKSLQTTPGHVPNFLINLYEDAAKKKRSLYYYICPLHPLLSSEQRCFASIAPTRIIPIKTFNLPGQGCLTVTFYWKFQSTDSCVYLRDLPFNIAQPLVHPIVEGAISGCALFSHMCVCVLFPSAAAWAPQCKREDRE